ncbi:hypothetical protein A9Q89_01780 [Gammaproteobacteria bacterium 53_120_T64]|nr:hypothetical protein A9Q89_01780 [Gammaproteobacteria bacterium 53_120_T64]
MHIKKYDFDYSRRFFMDKMAKGAMGAGVLTSMMPLVGNTGDISKAYPEELTNIEAFTKGKIKVGDIIDINNVEHVKDILDPVAYIQITQQGRRIRIAPTTTDITELYPRDYLEATLRNQGMGEFDVDGNVVVKGTGKPWVGGSPFPDPQTGLEAFANVTMSWGRHDTSVYAVEDNDIGPDGDIEYSYNLGWCEKNTVGLVSNPDGPYWEGHEDKLRYQAVWFTSPNDVKGTSFLNIWKYDQREFPDLFGYLPAFKRVRRFPTNQRFEPLVPGITFFLSDAWAAGDPMLTWGNYKIVGRGPFLGSQSGSWQGDQKNWSKDNLLHGGKKGLNFYEVDFQLCPEVIVVEAEPIGFPRAPVSKKRVWLDVRNMAAIGYVTYDRRGELWRSFEIGFSQQKQGDLLNPDSHGNPEWSWSYVHAQDVQTNRFTRFNHAQSIKGGLKTAFNTEDAYDKYLTIQAIRRLGS